MRRRSFLAGLLVAGVIPISSCRCSGQGEPGTDAGAAAGGDGGVAAPTLNEQSFELENGLKVDLVAGPCGDSVGLAVLLAFGIDHDPPERSGMAHLVERVLRASVEAGPRAHAVEASESFTLYSAVAPPDGVAGELDAVAAWMTNTPTSADLERERSAVLAELKERQGTNPAAAALSLAEESLFPTRNDGKRRGIAEQVEEITASELASWWTEHVKAGNARIVVVGGFDASVMRAHIERVFAPIARGTAPRPGEAAQATVKGTLVMGDAPTAVAIAVPAPASESSELPSFLVLAARLMQPVEGRRWEVAYDPIRRPELLFITGPVGTGEQPEPAANRIRKEVGQILEAPLAPEDTRRAEEQFRLFVAPQLLDPATCAKDARAFAIARARRGQLAGAVPPALDGANDELDAARARFGAKGSAAVIAGGTIPY